MSLQVLADEVCPVCTERSKPLDAVDFNKSCITGSSGPLPPSGQPIYYYLCESCGFCFAPEIARWPISEFKSRIYNDQYIEVDPDYKGLRPRANAAALIKGFGGQRSLIRHLDYGGGDGLLSSLLRDDGWDSTSYDPFVDFSTGIEDLGQFNLITAYEVFEHVPNPTTLLAEIGALLAHDGMVIFSTLTSDGQIARNQRISWWYAAPRNGHISLFSSRSLLILARSQGLSLRGSKGLFVMWKTRPEWASRLVRQG